MDDLRDLPLKALELSTRRHRVLVQRLGIETVGDLLKHTAHDLMRTRDFGQGCLDEVREALAAHGLMLPGDGSERKARSPGTHRSQGRTDEAPTAREAKGEGQSGVRGTTVGMTKYNSPPDTSDRKATLPPQEPLPFIEANKPARKPNRLLKNSCADAEV